MKADTKATGQLSVEQMQLIESRVANERKNVALAYVLWFFLGLWGVHNFYLGKIKLALFQMLGGIVSISLIVNTVNAGESAAPGMTLLSVVLLVCWIISFFLDMFLIPGRARRYSAQLRQQYASELIGARA